MALCHLARELIMQEQARQGNFILHPDGLQGYLEKVSENAEVLSLLGVGRCRGLVAYYCNDPHKERGFITLLLVHPHDRGVKLGRALISCALEHMRSLKLRSCELEVASQNAPALSLYLSLGFRTVDTKNGRTQMEILF